MPFIIFPRKNYTLIIGSSSNIRVNRFVFDKWEDDAVKKEFHNSVMSFLEENTELKKNGVLSVNNLTNESENGTKTGDKIDIIFYRNQISPEKIIEFLASAKITFHLAEPSNIPVKGVFTAIRDWFSSIWSR